MNKQTFTIFVALITGGATQAQEVIGSTGQTLAASNIIVSQTVGEVATATVANGTIATQGFHQGDLVITSISAPREGLDVSVYPNPFAQRVTILSQEDLGSIEISDAKGSLVRAVNGMPGQRRTTLELEDLSAGQYLLSIRPLSSSASTTYRITKN